MKVLILGNFKDRDLFEMAEQQIITNLDVPINSLKVWDALPEDLLYSDFTAVLIELVRISDAVMLLDGYKTELAASIALVNADKNEKTIYTLNGKGVTI